MHLLIDGQAMQTETSRRRGIGRYARNLVAALSVVRPQWDIELIQSEHLRPIDMDARLRCRLRSFRPPLPFAPGNTDLNENYYADWLTAQDADAVLVPSFLEHHALLPRFSGARPPFFGVLYDLIPLIYHAGYLTSVRECRWYADRLRLLLGTDMVLAISEASAQDWRLLFPEPRPEVRVISGGVDPAFEPHTAADLETYRRQFQQRFKLRREFILYVGGFDFRKNLVGAMQAFGLLPADQRRRLDLVIACELTRPQRTALLKAGHRLGIADSLRLTGYVHDEELRALYQLCRVFFFPSLDEGLGLPVLEALRCGGPVAASDCASVVEIAGAVSWLANAHSGSALAGALSAALVEPYAERRAARIEHSMSFRWERTAELAGQAIEAGPRPRACSPRPRIAWVSPLPPTSSLSADCSAALLGSLADRFEIDLVVDPDEPVVATELARRFQVLFVDEALSRQQTSPYDLLVYHLENTSCHLYMLPLLLRFPGLVVLHDSCLDALVRMALAADETLAEGATAGALLRTLAAKGAALVSEADAEAGAATDYSALIEHLIARRAARSAIWTDLAGDALARCTDPVAAEQLLEPWAQLRELGQRALHQRRREAPRHPTSEAA